MAQHAIGHPYVVQVAGHSNTGKTLLAEALVRLLPGRTGYVKWTHHPLPVPERPGSDTARIGSYGIPTVLACPDGLIVRNIPDVCTSSPAYDLRLREMLLSLGDLWDGIVIEGHKTGPGPKIVLGYPQGATAVTLRIAPNPPQDRREDWYCASLPLSAEQAARIARYISQNLERYGVPGTSASSPSGS